MGGARPLRRAIINILEDNLAEQFLLQPLHPKTRLTVSIDKNKTVNVKIDLSQVERKFSDEIDEINEIDETDEINDINEIDKLERRLSDEIDDTDGVTEIYEIDEIDEVDEIEPF